MAQWFANYEKKNFFEENKNVFSILDFVLKDFSQFLLYLLERTTLMKSLV